MNIDILVELYVWDLNGVIEQRNAPIAIDYPGLTEAESVLGRSERFG